MKGLNLGLKVRMSFVGAGAVRPGESLQKTRKLQPEGYGKWTLKTTHFSEASKETAVVLTNF